jgi:DNA-binding SARP family transcriptional activator
MVSLLLFGFPLAVLDGAAINIERRKVTGLLAYLAVMGRPCGREALAEVLFPELDRNRARADLRNTLSNLARVIGGDLLRTDHDAIWVQVGNSLSVDVVQFRRLAEAAGSPESSVSSDETLRTLESADRLVRGAFLAGFSLRDSPGFEEWQRDERERLRLEHAGVLDRLADIHEAHQGFEEAIGFAQKRLTLDNFDEPSYRRLMRLLLAGHRGALAPVQTVRRGSPSGLGTSPSRRPKSSTG